MMMRHFKPRGGRSPARAAAPSRTGRPPRPSRTPRSRTRPPPRRPPPRRRPSARRRCVGGRGATGGRRRPDGAAPSPPPPPSRRRWRRRGARCREQAIVTLRREGGDVDPYCATVSHARCLRDEKPSVGARRQRDRSEARAELAPREREHAARHDARAVARVRRHVAVAAGGGVGGAAERSHEHARDRRQHVLQQDDVGCARAEQRDQRHEPRLMPHDRPPPSGRERAPERQRQNQ